MHTFKNLKSLTERPITHTRIIPRARFHSHSYFRKLWVSHTALVLTNHDLHSRNPCMLKPPAEFAQFQRMPCITIDERHRLIDLTICDMKGIRRFSFHFPRPCLNRFTLVITAVNPSETLVSPKYMSSHAELDSLVHIVK